MTDTSTGLPARAEPAAPRDRPDASAARRVAELEAEVAALRRALARAGLDAERASERHGGELAEERAGRAADAAGAEARHGRAMAASRADLAASEGANEALRRVNADLAASRAALREREARLRLIFDSATDYAIFGMDLDRRVTSWNEGAERLLGWTEDEIVGRPADVIFTPEDRVGGEPGREAEGASRDGRAADERWHQRRDGTRFWANGLMLPLRDPDAGPAAPPLGFLKVMRDETGRRRAEEALREAEARQGFLLRLADTLRPLHDPEEMQAEACRLLGQHLGVAQVGFGRIDDAQERVTVHRDWNDGRIPSVAGTWRMDDFGPAFVAAMKRGETAAIPDIALDPRTGAPEVAAAYAGIGTRAILGVPLVKGGRMAAMLFVHHPEPRPWSAADVGVVEETCERLWAAVERARAEEERRRAEERRGLLVAELNHRVKNTLAVVQSLALQTARGAPDLASFSAAFQARLIALARAHDLLTRQDWQGAPLAEVARAALEGSGARVALDACASSAALLPPAQALALAMALHELATNALKHGALSAPGGRVSVACRAEQGGGARVLEWVERGGPPVPGPPARRGFGLRLLERGLAAQAGMAADLRFEAEGVRCTLRLPPTRAAHGEGPR